MKFDAIYNPVQRICDRFGKTISRDDLIEFSRTLFCHCYDHFLTLPMNVDGAKAHAFHPDAILLDLNTPKSDGFEVLRILRQTPHPRS